MLPVAGEQDRIGDDEVFGACQGSCAEFASTGWNQLALKPANLGLEAAGAPGGFRIAPSQARQEP